MEELADKLGFVQTSLFLNCFLFLLFSSSVSLFYMSATATAALNKSAMLQITVCFDFTRVWPVKEQVCKLFAVCQHEFASLSLPCEGRFTDGNFPSILGRIIAVCFKIGQCKCCLTLNAFFLGYRDGSSNDCSSSSGLYFIRK